MTQEPATPATPVVTITRTAGDVTEGSPLRFLVRAEPAPPVDLTIVVTIASSGGCELTQAPESVPIAAGEKEATLTVPTSGAGAGAEGCMVTATIAVGRGYRVGAAAASAGATVTPDPAVTPTPMQPVVTIARTTDATVTAGNPVSFTLTAEPAPAADLTVNVSWSQSGSFLAASGPQTVTIDTSGTATLPADTVDDSADEPDGSVTVTVEAGSGYTVGSPGSATVAVTDDVPATPGDGGGAPAGPVGCQTEDCPLVNVAAVSKMVTEGSSAAFTLTATPAPTADLTVKLEWTIFGGEPKLISSDRPTTVTIDTSGTETVTVATSDDMLPNYGGETVLIVVVVKGNGYLLGLEPSASVTVDDDETP